MRNETVRDSTGQDLLEATVRKRRLRWFGHVQRMEDSRRAKQALNWFPDEKRKRGRPHVRLHGGTHSGEYAWTRHGRTSVSRQQTEKSESNGPPDVLVTGRTKVR